MQTTAAAASKDNFNRDRALWARNVATVNRLPVGGHRDRQSAIVGKRKDVYDET